MTGPLGLWMGMRWLSKYRSFFLFTMSFSSFCLSTSFPPVSIVYFVSHWEYHIVSIVSWLREMRATEKKMIK
jgi:hypothetical protein